MTNTTESFSRTAPSILALQRFLNPRSVAVVGASESQRRSDNSVGSMLGGHVDLHLVNPNRPTVYGRPTVPSLSAIDGPVDAVLCMVNAERAIDVVAEASALGCGGVVVISSGYRETGDEGAEREKRLIAAAGDMPLVGPNCNGFANIHRGVRLSGAPPVPAVAGNVGLVTQSGGFVAFAMLAARERGLGMSTVVSTGNEAQLDLVDYMNFLVDDPQTRVITLIVERLDRPIEFLAAAERAREAGKPVLALRLARGSRARAIAQSHTGAIVAGGAAIDAALASAGVVSVADIDELLDAAAIFAQVAPERWKPVSNTAILTASGGTASLMSDIFEGAGIGLPALEDLSGKLEAVPGATEMNPLDLTGFVLGRPDLFRDVVQAYDARDDIDALIFVWGVDEYFREFAGELFDRFAEIAAESDKLLLIASVVDSRVDGAVPEVGADRVAQVRSLRGLVTGLKAMDVIARGRDRAATAADPAPAHHVDLASAPRVASEIGPILPFVDAMGLLSALDIAVADHAVLDAPPTDALDFAGPYVVKVAEAPHRGRIGGVRVGVAADEVAGTLAELRGVAEAHDVAPPSVAVQPLLRGDAELYVGLEMDSPFGPIILCGLGGADVETTSLRAARLAPLSEAEADSMVTELEQRWTRSGLGSAAPWDGEELARVLVAVGGLAAEPLVQSLDINPLIIRDGHAVAVDALCVLRADQP